MAGGENLDRSAQVLPSLLVRGRLLESIRGRWDRRLTAVLAGAGFGKSTLVAQSIAENRMTASGTDILVVCRETDGPTQVAGSVLRGLSIDEPVEDSEGLVDLVVRALLAIAPRPLCICVDDAHELESGGRGERFLKRLVHGAPDNTSFLVASRRELALPVAQLAARRQAIVVREPDLVMSEAELEQFAGLRGVPVDQVLGSGGWPALAELLASAPGVTPVEYVWEQVIRGLGPGERRALAIAGAVGPLGPELRAELVPELGECTDALGSVPLVNIDAGGTVYLHDLWRDALRNELTTNDREELQRRAAALLAAQGETDRAVRLLIECGAKAELLALLRTELLSVGHWQLALGMLSWSSLVEDELRDEPVIALLDALSGLVEHPGSGLDRFVRAARMCKERGDEELELLVLGWVGAAALHSQQFEPIMQFQPRLVELAAAGHSEARLLALGADAMVALTQGFARRAVEEMEAALADGDSTGGFATWMLGWARYRLGRLDAAMNAFESEGAIEEVVVAMRTRFFRGEVDEVMVELARETMFGRDFASLPTLAKHDAALIEGLFAAMTGDLDRAGFAIARLRDDAAATALTAFQLMVTLAVDVLVDLGRGDESAAAAKLRSVADLMAVYPPPEGIAVWYLVCPEVRAVYDEIDLDGVWAWARAAAAALVAAREQADVSLLRSLGWPAVGTVRANLPPVIAIELAVRAAAAGNTPPVELVDACLGPGRVILGRLDKDDDALVRAEARRLRARVPRRAPAALEVRLLSTPMLLSNGTVVTHPRLRQARVRELLSLLVAERSVTRSHAARLLWPDLDETRAANNLRVALSGLNAVLEPDRTPEEPPYFVRADLQRISLVEDPSLSSDVWDFDTAWQRAQRSERDRAPHAALAAYLEMVELFTRSAPQSDPEQPEWLTDILTRHEVRLVAAALRAGELLLAQGEPERAAALAERALQLEPYSERAHVLAASAAWARDDVHGAAAALAGADQCARELGVSPSSDLEMLRRRLGREPREGTG